MKGKINLFLCLWAVFLLAAAVTTGCKNTSGYHTKVGMVWNTTYHITYNGPEELDDSITATLNAVGACLNVFDSTSNLSRLNRGETKQADAMLVKVLTMARNIYNATDGAFDPTLGPVIRAWGFGKGHEATADTARLDSMRQFVGFDKWALSCSTVKRAHSGVEMNLSGIAKGYGCDAVAEMLRRNGVSDFMVEIGGEIRMGGANPDGGKWTIAIDKPVVSDSVIHDYLTTISLTDCGLATSGNYRNFHTDADGNRFGHTLDPKTLRPAKIDVLSATVVAGSSMEADGYATAFVVLGSKRALQVAEKQKLAVLLVTAKGVEISSSMSKYLDQAVQQ